MKTLRVAALLAGLLTMTQAWGAGSPPAPKLVSAYLVAKGGSHTLEIGSTLQFLAYGIYSDGSIAELPDAQGDAITLWNTSDHAVAKISSLGHVTPAGAGSIEIEGSAGTMVATPWQLTVTAAPPILPPTVSCSGEPGLVRQGDTATITSVGTSPQGSALSYSDTASAGSMRGAGASEQLLTSKSVAGAVTITCAVAQQGGGSASAKTKVTVATSPGTLDGAKNWEGVHDAGTPGESHGSTVYPAAVAPYDNAREFYLTYADQAGERYSLSFGDDPTPTHFVYMANVFLVDPSQVANVEMDINQVMEDGKTVIFGTQCSAYSGMWEYTTDAKEDAAKKSNSHWSASTIPCNPTQWAASRWHAIEIASSRDQDGTVTYEWVSVDGVVQPFVRARGLSASSLGWRVGSLSLNFQLDGVSKKSGSITAYVHDLTVYYW